MQRAELEARSTPAELVHPRRERALGARVERDVPRAPTTARLLEDADADRIVEPPRSRAGRVEVPDAAYALVVRQVAVPEEDHVGGRAPDLVLHFLPRPLRAIEDVHQQEVQPTQLGARRLARLAAAEAIDISGAGGDRRDGAELRQQLLAADVAGVEDVIDTAEGVEHLGAQEAVGVGDDA